MDTEAIRLVSSGDFSAAIKTFTELIKDNSHAYSRAQLYCNRAGCYEQLELYKHVVKDCDAALELDPSLLRAVLRKAKALVKLRKPKAAVKLLDQTCSALGGGDHDMQLLLELHALRACGGVEAAPAPAPPPAAAPQAPSPAPAPAPAAPPSPHGSEPASSRRGAVSQDAVASTSERGREGGAAQAAPVLARRDPAADEALQMGILQVNTGHLTEAVAIFERVLAQAGWSPTAAEAHVARGTARAMQGDLRGAEADFTAALAILPQGAEAYKRRGQTRSALGEVEAALRDFAAALRLEPSWEIYYERGLTYYNKIKDYHRARADFAEAVHRDGAHPSAWNMYGLACLSLGDCEGAVRHFEKAIGASPAEPFKEALANLAQAYKEMTNAPMAHKLYQQVLALDPGYTHAARFFCLLLHGQGRMRECVQAATAALQAKPFAEGHFIRGLALHALGHHYAAVKEYNVVTKMAVEESDRGIQHLAFYHRELAQFVRAHLDTPLSQLPRALIDDRLSPLFKEAWCKKLSPACLLTSDYTSQPQITAEAAAGVEEAEAACPRSVPPEPGATMASPAAQRLVREAERIGALIQYDAAGFLVNERMHRMAGLAALHLSQVVGDVVAARRAQGPGSAPARQMGWREALQVVVTWRQVCEPNDAVVWVDQLTRSEFEAGFGSHTPMLSGQTKVVRYYPNFDRAFALTKQLMLERGWANDVSNQPIPVVGPVAASVHGARTCSDLHAALGADFWIVTPCRSTAAPGVDLDGTRLTLQKLAPQPDAFEYSIRTPCTPARWAQFDTELGAAWEALLAAMQGADQLRTAKCILRLVFYWYNFMPLARGTAAVGCITLLGLFQAAGMPLTCRIPPNTQIDWLAILSTSPEAFMAAVEPWLLPPAARAPGEGEGSSPSEQPTAAPDAANVPRVDACITTIRAMIEVLNADGWNV